MRLGMAASELLCLPATHGEQNNPKNEMRRPRGFKIVTWSSLGYSQRQNTSIWRIAPWRRQSGLFNDWELGLEHPTLRFDEKGGRRARLHLYNPRTRRFG
jgi:hypothetical protein